jgi:hypothetical protein
MPNWCNNTLTLKHEDASMLDRFVKGYEADGVFGEFLPIPEELKGGTAPYRGDEAEGKRLLEAYGAADWYEWCVKNWGTKWDITDDGSGYTRPNPNTLSVGFDTAWAPPIQFYEYLESLGFRVEATYFEPGMGFVGSYVDGMDDYYDYSGMDSEEAEGYIPDYLNEQYGITEMMREFEDERE